MLRVKGIRTFGITNFPQLSTSFSMDAVSAPAFSVLLFFIAFIQSVMPVLQD